MNDTQWRRYQVFVQSKPGEPHQDAGSVHAPDAEFALQFARDVFARRPSCVSTWVVPSDEITTMTREVLQEIDIPGYDSDSPTSDTQEYLVFFKIKHSGTHIHIGHVRAADQKQALAMAMLGSKHEFEPLSCWVIESERITQSDPSEVESLFEPANHKTFRDSADYHTLSAIRAIERIKGSGKKNTE